MKITKKEINKQTQVTKLSFSNFEYKCQIKNLFFEARNDNQMIICNDTEIANKLQEKENYLEIGNKQDFINAIYKILKYLI